MLSNLRSIVQEVNSADGLKEALEIIVRRVREIMGTEVCTVYMLDPATNRLVFQATQGLNKTAEGLISLGADEGLVGLVAKREEPLNLENAVEHPKFQLLPGIGEEKFKSFLGSPIIHHRKVLGVLVVQEKKQRRFDESEEAFLVTVSAQLAGVIAHAQATGAISGLRGAGRGMESVKFTGVAGASGIAIGRAVVISLPADLRAVPHRETSDIKSELAFFNKCLQAVRNDIRKLDEKLSSRHQSSNCLFAMSFIVI